MGVNRIGKDEPYFGRRQVAREILGDGEVEPVAVRQIFGPFVVGAEIGNRGLDLGDHDLAPAVEADEVDAAPRAKPKLGEHAVAHMAEQAADTACERARVALRAAPAVEVEFELRLHVPSFAHRAHITPYYSPFWWQNAARAPIYELSERGRAVAARPALREAMVGMDSAVTKALVLAGKMDLQDTLEIAEWIVAEGLGGASEASLVQGFCERIIASGVPLKRAYMGQRTLHPIYAGHTFEWNRGETEVKQQGWDRTDVEDGKAWETSPFQHMATTGTMKMRRRLEATNVRSEFPLLDELREKGATDYLAVMTPFGRGTDRADAKPDGIVSSWTSDQPGGFSDDDIFSVEQLLPVFALAFKDASTRRIAHDVVGTYLGRDAGERVLSGEISRGSVETIRAVLWYCDLQGFTRIADRAPQEQLITMLNEYFECMVEPVQEHGGQVLKFLGDGLLAIFKLDDDARADVCPSALDAAEEAQARVAALNTERRAAGLPVAEMYLALHLGNVMYGNIGARDRLDFTVVGPAVNEVSRIVAMCASLDQDLVISSAFAAAAGQCKRRLVSLGRYALRGVRKPQELFTLAPSEEACPDGPTLEIKT